MLRRSSFATALVLTLAACGAIPDVGDLAEIDEEASEPGSNVSADAMATLVAGEETYTWDGNEWTFCEIGGSLPVWVEFSLAEDKWSDDWFQFIDRGDGGINFSAYLDGKEYHGTTGDEAADEIRSDGFSFTGDMTVDGEPVGVSLDVTC